MRRSPNTAAPCWILCGLLCAISTPAEAQLRPRIGERYLSAGAVFGAGALLDPSVPADPNFGTFAPAASGMLHAGFHHFPGVQFEMSAELDAGVQWFNDHTATPEIGTASEYAFSWQVGVAGRWLSDPFDDAWVFGGGVRWFRAGLRDGALQSLAIEPHFGRMIFDAADDFVLAEVVYAFPIVQGVDRPGIVVLEDVLETVPQDWSLHRLSFVLQYGF